MKFYQGLLPRVIWDGSNNCMLCEFDLATKSFETEDENIIALLKESGYMTEEDQSIYLRTGSAPHGGFRKDERVVDETELPSRRKPVEEEGDKPLHPSQVKPKVIETVRTQSQRNKEAAPIMETTVDGEVIKKRPKQVVSEEGTPKSKRSLKRRTK